MKHNLTRDRASDMGRKSAQTRRLNALEKRIKELVEAAPPLTDEQRDRITLALRPSA